MWYLKKDDDDVVVEDEMVMKFIEVIVKAISQHTEQKNDKIGNKQNLTLGKAFEIILHC